MNILSVKNISCSVGEKIILNDVSFELESGKVLGISGESGSGKTTLAKILLGIIKQNSGEIIFNFKESWSSTPTHPVQMLFQNNGEILNPFREIGKVVEEAIRLNDKNSDIKSEKEKLFSAVNLPENLWKRKGFELSGGEQQRAALARILALRPELLILDEPFSAQDPVSQLNLLNLFKKIKDEFNLTIICVAHNLKILKKLADEVIILYKGNLVEKGNSEKIFSSPEHPYTKFLLKAENYNLTYDELKAELH